MAFAPVFGRLFPPTFDRHAAVVAAANWWQAGGAPTPIAVYQPKGAASQAASYVNLANPGTNDAAPGVAPSWSSAGWAFNGSDQYLTTGITAQDDKWSMLIRLSGAPTSGLAAVIGYRDVFSTKFQLWSSLFGSVGYENNQDTTQSPGLATGVISMAAQTGYRDGIQDVVGGAPYATGAGTNTVYVGCCNNNGTASWFAAFTCIAVAIWNTSTGHATWMPAVSAAVALI